VVGFAFQILNYFSALVESKQAHGAWRMAQGNILTYFALSLVP
jgi:hypothetical protein